MFCQWLTAASAAFAARLPVQVSAASVADTGSVLVDGLSVLGQQAKLPASAVAAFNDQLLALGAAHVDELTPDDWSGLPAWCALRSLERRRLAACIGFAFA